jgi:hypothetical protein
MQITSGLTQSSYHYADRDYSVSCWSRLRAMYTSVAVISAGIRVQPGASSEGRQNRDGKSTGDPADDFSSSSLPPVPSSYRARAEAGSRDPVSPGKT